MKLIATLTLGALLTVGILTQFPKAHEKAFEVSYTVENAVRSAIWTHKTHK